MIFIFEHKNDCKLLFFSYFSYTEAEHKKQNIFQRALGGGGGGDKNYHSNSTKLKVKSFHSHSLLKGDDNFYYV